MLYVLYTSLLIKIIANTLIKETDNFAELFLLPPAPLPPPPLPLLRLRCRQGVKLPLKLKLKTKLPHNIC